MLTAPSPPCTPPACSSRASPLSRPAPPPCSPAGAPALHRGPRGRGRRGGGVGVVALEREGALDEVAVDDECLSAGGAARSVCSRVSGVFADGAGRGVGAGFRRWRGVGAGLLRRPGAG